LPVILFINYRSCCSLLFAVFFLAMASGQELRCQISVTYDKIQGGSQRQIFENMQTALYEYMNNQAWTNHVFSYEERIECAIYINLDEQVSQTEFKGTMQIQTGRPVFNSGYKTTLLNYRDKDIQFTYIENEPLEFTISSFTSNLTSLLAFYAYIIIGLDYDSFSAEGGTEFFQKAETVVMNAQSAKEKGWKAFESSDHKNRYWLINNILNDKYRPLRSFYYTYHRLGLDMMAEKPNEARSEMMKAVEQLQTVYRSKPDPFMHYLNILFDAKTEEFINVFSESPMDERTRVARILMEVDPPNAGKYKQMRDQQQQ